VHAPAFMICRSCGTVAEAEAGTGGAFGRRAAEAGFRIERTVMEAEGLCPACQEAA
jgi:Fur family zinc uptake transcriptional regulator